MTAFASTARLSRYRPGLVQQAHAHDEAHLSLLLSGGFEEQAGRRHHAAEPGQLGLRPEGLRHAVAFGGTGAVVLTLGVSSCDGARGSFAEPAWTPPLPGRHLRRLVPLILEGGEDAPEAIWDVLALIDLRAESPRPDPWLADVRDQLRACPGPTRVSDLALRAGRHRVHLGRAFLTAYGETPSEFRRRAMLDRALGLMASGQPLAAAAIDAGFSDQSHFSRACRDLYNLPPGRLASRLRG
ncbi:AraC family transcriptional regulator [Brevundimonas sp. AAP58]|uniref:helix-turn-helix domain-containing protein n=1 Tax=Brevundimonas sp. AAP58 TaxID=1523422 RepID=UPI0006B8D721|nr:helix-turn-helix domain-containing protein [Brevundimonas sp. AAP58]